MDEIIIIIIKYNYNCYFMDKIITSVIIIIIINIISIVIIKSVIIIIIINMVYKMEFVEASYHIS